MPLFENLEEYGDKPALEDDSSETISFRDLAIESDFLMSTLLPNTVILLVGSNDIPTILCYVGALRNQISPTIISNKSSSRDVLNILERFEVPYIFCEETFAKSFFGYQSIARVRNYVLLSSSLFVPRRINPEIALLLPTSGSTGSHKVVRLSRGNLESNTKSIVESLDIEFFDQGITSLPFYYTFGLSIINTHLASGAFIRLTNHSVIQRQFWEIVKMSGATSFSGVPYTFRTLSRLNIENLLENTRLDYVTQAGGKLAPEEVVKWHSICKQFGIEFIVMYGQTEATARMTVLRGRDLLRKPASVGKAINRGEFRVCTNDSSLSETGEGELIYMGPNVSMGYAETRADLERGDDNKGILPTGDIGKIDDEGFVYVLGRKGGVAKIRGIRIDLADLEGKISQLGFDFAILEKSEKIFFFVLDHAHVKGIQEILKQYPIIRSTDCHFNLVSEIPRTEAGKLSYVQLETLVKERQESDINDKR